jgi:hypothetical protein
MELVQKQSARRGRVVWSGLISLLLLLVGGAIWKSARSSAAMSKAAGSDEMQFTQAATGSKVKVVMEIGEAGGDGTLRGILLQKKTEEDYTRTTTTMVTHFSEHTALVMGKREDVRAGAVVHITGIVREDRSIDAERIVILTDYVHVQ